MDTKLPPFIVRVVSYGASVMMMSFGKVPSLLMKSLIVFQKDLLNTGPSLAFFKNTFSLIFFLKCYIYF